MDIGLPLLLATTFLISLFSLDGVSHHAFDNFLVHSHTSTQTAYFINNWYNALSFPYFSAGALLIIPLFIITFIIAQRHHYHETNFIDILKGLSLLTIFLYTIGYLIDDVATFLSRECPFNQFLGHFLLFLFTACIGCFVTISLFTRGKVVSKAKLSVILILMLGWGVFADIYTISRAGNPFINTQIQQSATMTQNNNSSPSPTLTPYPTPIEEKFSSSSASVKIIGGVYSSSDIANMKKNNATANFYRKYSITLLPGWSAKEIYPGEIDNDLTIKKDSYTIEILEGQGDGGSCAYPGDTLNQGIQTFFNEYTQLTDIDGNRYRRGYRDIENESVIFTICQYDSTYEQYYDLDRLGWISYSVPSDYTQEMLSQMDNMIQSIHLE